MIKKAFNIITGWGKRLGYLEVTPAERKMAELRAQICEGCPFRGSSSVLQFIKGSAEKNEVAVCTKCHCPIEEKTIVTGESCPVKKW